MINNLITSAGRRAELVQLFHRELRKSVPGRKIIATGAQNLAPARSFAGVHVTLPRVDSPRGIGELKALMLLPGVNHVVPTIAPELYALSKHWDGIERSTRTWVLIAGPDTIQMPSDKRPTQIRVRQNDLLATRVHETVDDIRDDDLSVVLEPQTESSSIGVCITRTREQLTFFDANTIDPFCRHSSNLRRPSRVKPVLTGISHFSGRTSLCREQEVDLDFKYVDEWSPGVWE